jgi:hypothetical protein
MRKPLHIWPRERTVKDGMMTIGARLEKEGQKSFDLWFRVPAEHSEAVTGTCDPFVIAAIFPAMKGANSLVVHGEVSTSLLANLEEFQAVWSSWVPAKYQEVSITVDKEYQSNGHHDQEKAIMAFSGGIDSCFTAYQHKRGLCGRRTRNLVAGVKIHGLDIPLADKDAFDHVAERSRKILASVGVQLIPMATNFRAMGDDWDDSHGSAVAACLTLFQNGYGSGLIAGSFAYDGWRYSMPWGSNPFTDSLLSTDRFRISDDGMSFGRVDKLQAMSEWPEALQYSKVCWEGRDLERNCCRCEKCIRNILAYRALGVPRPGSFEEDVTDQQIENVCIPDTLIMWEYRKILSAARSRNIDAPWVRALGRCICRNERRLNGGGNWWKRFRSTVALRSRLRKLYSRLASGAGVLLQSLGGLAMVQQDVFW